jgi:hypothetical protein
MEVKEEPGEVGARGRIRERCKGELPRILYL